MSVALLLATSAHLYAQGTAPRSLNNATVQSDLPGNYKVSEPRQDLPHETQAPVTPSSGLSARLDTFREVLALLLKPDEFKTLMDAEDTKFGVADSVKKLAHRRSAVTTIIAQMKATV